MTMTETKTHPFTCDRCSEGYSSAKYGRYCSTECYKGPEPERLCGYCGKDIGHKRKGAIYCDDTCKDRTRRQREKHAREPDWKPKRGGKRGPRFDDRKHQPGTKFDGTSLTLVEHVERKGATYALFRCDCGNEKVLQVRYVEKATTKDCADRANHSDPRGVGDKMQAGTWHRHLARKYGSATTLPCAACGVVDEGNCWSYRHSSAEARCQLTGKDKGWVYSVNDEDYWVLCRSHHAAFDRKHAETAPLGTLSLAHVALGMAYDPDYDA